MTGFIKLKNMGLDPSLEALTAYGNTASAMGKSLNDMVEAVADAATGEFERLKEFGIKASTQGKNVVFTFQGTKTVVKKEAADIEKYLKRVGLVNFAGGIESQSKTLYGQWSTLADNSRMVAASLGKLLIPAVNDLFKKVGPLIERIQKWVDANPQLARRIMTLTAALGAGMLAFGGVMKVVGFAFSGFGTAYRIAGGLIKGANTAISIGGKIAVTAVKGYDALKYGMFALQYGMKFTVIPALKSAGTAIMEFGATLLASPITWYVLAAVALGTAVYFIIKNWDKISAFFSRLWQGIKNVFSRFWNWFKNSIFIYFYPPLLIFKYWDKIAPFFKNLWQGVKSIFSAAWRWVVDLHVKFYDAGKNIVISIWNGMKTMITKPVELMAQMTKKMRDYLPFSPAKTGALRDIHRIKLVETVAQSIKARPLLNAWGNVTSQLYGHMQRPLPTPSAAGGGSVHITFSPTINLNGGATEADGRRITDQLKTEFAKLMRDYSQQKQRVAF